MREKSGLEFHSSISCAMITLPGMCLLGAPHPLLSATSNDHRVGNCSLWRLGLGRPGELWAMQAFQASIWSFVIWEKALLGYGFEFFLVVSYHVKIIQTTIWKYPYHTTVKAWLYTVKPVLLVSLNYMGVSCTCSSLSQPWTVMQ